MGALYTMIRCKRAINNAITYFFGSDYLPVQGGYNADFYISSTELGASNVWGMTLGLGYVAQLAKQTAYRVRPVCQEV